MNKTRDAAAAIADQAAIDIDNFPGASTKYREGMIDGCQRAAAKIRALPDSDADKVIAELVGALDECRNTLAMLIDPEGLGAATSSYTAFKMCTDNELSARKALAKAREYMEE